MTHLRVLEDEYRSGSFPSSVLAFALVEDDMVLAYPQCACLLI